MPSELSRYQYPPPVAGRHLEHRATRLGFRRVWSLLSLLFAIVALAEPAFGQTSEAPSKSTSGFRKCVIAPSCPNVLDAAYQLAKHREFEFLLSEYRVAGENTRGWIVQAIYASEFGRDDPRVITFMKTVAFRSKQGDLLSDTSWYALQFLAETCDERALSMLTAHGGNERNVYDYQVACGDWAKSLKAFGTCKYAAAREVLLNSLNSSCLDVVQSAGDSLDVLYPGQCLKEKTFAEAADCYHKSWQEHKP